MKQLRLQQTQHRPRLQGGYEDSPLVTTQKQSNITLMMKIEFENK